MNKTECAFCKGDYPSRFVNHLTVNAGTYLACPDCALEIINEAHGLPKNTPFQGEYAKEIYDDFQLWKANKTYEGNQNHAG